MKDTWGILAKHFSGSKLGKKVPGDTDREKLDNAADSVQAGLDVAGAFDPTPISDGVNAALYVGRAALDPKNAKDHLKNAAISAVSMIPYVGDLAKLLKVKKTIKLGKRMTKAAKLAHNYAKAEQTKRRVKSGEKLGINAPLSSYLAKRDDVPKFALGGEIPKLPTRKSPDIELESSTKAVHKLTRETLSQYPAAWLSNKSNESIRRSHADYIRDLRNFKHIGRGATGKIDPEQTKQPTVAQTPARQELRSTTELPELKDLSTKIVQKPAEPPKQPKLPAVVPPMPVQPKIPAPTVQPKIPAVSQETKKTPKLPAVVPPTQVQPKRQEAGKQKLSDAIPAIKPAVVPAVNTPRKVLIFKKKPLNQDAAQAKPQPVSSSPLPKKLPLPPKKGTVQDAISLLGTVAPQTLTSKPPEEPQQKKPGVLTRMANWVVKQPWAQPLEPEAPENPLPTYKATGIPTESKLRAKSAVANLRARTRNRSTGADYLYFDRSNPSGLKNESERRGVSQDEVIRQDRLQHAQYLRANRLRNPKFKINYKNATQADTQKLLTHYRVQRTQSLTRFDQGLFDPRKLNVKRTLAAEGKWNVRSNQATRTARYEQAQFLKKLRSKGQLLPSGFIGPQLPREYTDDQQKVLYTQQRYDDLGKRPDKQRALGRLLDIHAPQAGQFFQQRRQAVRLERPTDDQPVGRKRNIVERSLGVVQAGFATAASIAGKPTPIGVSDGSGKGSDQAVSENTSAIRTLTGAVVNAAQAFVSGGKQQSPTTKGFALGGEFSGSGRAVPGVGEFDSVNAKLRPGEHVLTPEQVKDLGGHKGVDATLKNMRNLSGRGAKRFAAGGPATFSEDVQANRKQMQGNGSSETSSVGGQFAELGRISGIAAKGLGSLLDFASGKGVKSLSGFVAAVLEGPPAIKAFAQGVAAANDKLKTWDGNIALSSARLERDRMLRERSEAKATSGSASVLNDSVSEMEGSLQDISNSFKPFINVAGIVFAKTINFFASALVSMTPIKQIGQGVDDIVKWLFGKDDTAMTPFQKFLDDAAEDAKNNRPDRAGDIFDPF